METYNVKGKLIPKQIVVTEITHKGWEVIVGQVLNLELSKARDKTCFDFIFIDFDGRESSSYFYLDEFDVVFKYLPADKYEKLKAFL